MKVVIKLFGYLLLGVLFFAVLALLYLYQVTQDMMDSRYQILPSGIQVPSDSQSISRGSYLVNTIGLCGECHGADLGGMRDDEGWLVGVLVISNLTPGSGGIGAQYTDEDWVRAIRHGVGKNGRPLLLMPSATYYYFSDSDLGAIIAYLKTLPPVNRQLGAIRLGPLGRYYILMDPRSFAARLIDHDAPRPPQSQPGVTVAYGAYLAKFCTECHGDDLSGSLDPGAGLNLTPAGNLVKWKESDFMRAMRQGITPEGKQLDESLMPYPRLAQMSDQDLQAIWAYLQTIPAVATHAP